MNALNSSDFTETRDPFALLKLWLAEAGERELNDPEAMTLASVDAAGMPDARMVLCKQADERGLVFYSNARAPRAGNWRRRRRRRRCSTGNRCAGKCACAARWPGSRTARRTPISPPGRASAASAPGRASSRGRSNRAPSSGGRGGLRGEIRRGRNSAPRLLGRLPADADRNRILAGRASSACTIASCSRARARASRGAASGFIHRRAGARQVC